MNAEPQVLMTEGGEELVVLSRRAYDTLLARLGDEAAEDRATAQMADDHIAAAARGDIALVPAWFVDLTMEHGSTIAAARRHAGLTHDALAERIGLGSSAVADLERGHGAATPALLARIAAATGIEAAWLAD